MLIFFFILIFNINSEPIHKIIKVYAGYSDEQIADEVNRLKPIYDKNMKSCREYSSEITCRRTYDESNPNAICNENGLHSKLKSVYKNTPILDIKLYGYNGRIDLTVLKGKIPKVQIYTFPYSSELSIANQNRNFNHEVHNETFNNLSRKKNAASYDRILLVGNIKDKVSYLYIKGKKNSLANLKIVDAPLDCETLDFEYGSFLSFEQPIKTIYFRADEIVNPSINWDYVKCDQFIYNIDKMSYYYYRIKFESYSAVLYYGYSTGQYFELLDEYDNGFSIPYDSVNGKIGIYTDSTHVDVNLDTSSQININVINITFDDYPESGGLDDPDSDGLYSLYITSNKWMSQQIKPLVYVYGNDRIYRVKKSGCSLHVQFQNPYIQNWSEDDNNYFKYEDDNSEDDDNNGSGMKKSTLIIIIVACVAVVVIVAIIVTVVIIKKKRNANDKSTSEGE